MEDFSEFNLIGRSPAFLSALNLIRRFSTCDATVLIQGETGTGKELAARAIHYLSRRREFPFIPVNCGALPDSLIENELFGHARGAFTDAREPMRGLVADAEGGTLFLDEIESLSPKGQIVLLRFLQDRVYRPLGGRSLVSGDLRVIAASNTDLTEIVSSQGFREDLMYRLAILSITMPALRERPGDVELLVRHFMHRFAQQYQQRIRELDAQSILQLSSYSWPGNVRELENLIHREFLMSDDHIMKIADSRISSCHACAEPHVAPGTPALIDMGFRSAKARAIADFERAYVEELLGQTNGNITQAAQLSGKDRSAFGKLVKKYRIDLHTRRLSSAPD